MPPRANLGGVTEAFSGVLKRFLSFSVSHVAHLRFFGDWNLWLWSNPKKIGRMLRNPDWCIDLRTAPTKIAPMRIKSHRCILLWYVPYALQM